MSSGILTNIREQSTSYLAYAKNIFEELFDMNVAMLCTCEGNNDGVCSGGYLRAAIPREALDVFLGNIFGSLYFSIDFFFFLGFLNSSHCASGH